MTLATMLLCKLMPPVYTIGMTPKCQNRSAKCKPNVMGVHEVNNASEFEKRQTEKNDSRLGGKEIITKVFLIASYFLQIYDLYIVIYIDICCCSIDLSIYLSILIIICIIISNVLF